MAAADMGLSQPPMSGVPKHESFSRFHCFSGHAMTAMQLFQRGPTISVVIPTRNRPASLARTVAALRAQTCAPREVIIVDASDSPVEPAVAGHQPLPFPPLPFPIVWLRTPRGVCHQRNVGIQQAGGTHVLLCDDDMEPPADYLQKLLAF